MVEATAAKARDPVCGMDVDPARAGAKLEHAGRSYYFCCAHCAARFKHAPQKYLQPAMDPVCGMKVEPANAAAEIEHGGRSYYFCSKHCAQKFNADPAKYAAKAPPASTPVAGAKYTCPMHPEIVQAGPGT
jgi:Cu+-exporting ATPase